MKKRILAFMLVFSMCFGVCLTTLATVEINEHLTYVHSATVPNTTNNLFKSGTIVESEMKDGYTHYLAGNGNISNFWAAYLYETPDNETFEEPDPYYVTEDGKEYYTRHDRNVFTKRNLVVDGIYDGEKFYEGTFPAWYDSIMQFVMVDGETGECTTTYCADQKTGTIDGYNYLMRNVEDATYYSENEAAMIRTVAYNGYWGTESGFGSLESFKEFARNSGKFTEIEIAEINDGIAMAATQYAIWNFSNEMNDIEYINLYYSTRNAAPSKHAEREDAQLIMKLYNYLIGLEPVKVENTTADIIINDDNFLGDLSVAVVEKISGHINNSDKDLTNDAYITDLSFKMELLPDIDKDNLVATVYDSENNLLASGRIAGELQEGEVRLETDGKGKFTFKNLELIEGVQELQIYLEGSQKLNRGVYLYSSEVNGEDSSQTMVGVADGYRKVNVNAADSVVFEVNDPIKTFSFKKGEASNISYMLIDKNGNVEFLYKKDIDSTDTTLDIVSKDGYISAVFVKQAQTGMLWVSEEVDDAMVEKLIATVKTNNKSYKACDGVEFGAGEHTLTYKNGGKKTKNVVYVFE